MEFVGISGIILWEYIYIYTTGIIFKQPNGLVGFSIGYVSCGIPFYIIISFYGPHSIVGYGISYGRKWNQVNRRRFPPYGATMFFWQGVGLSCTQERKWEKTIFS